MEEQTGPDDSAGELLERKLVEEQLRLASMVITDDSAAGFAVPVPTAKGPQRAPIDSSQHASLLPPLSLVGGVDISFVPGRDLAVAAVVVLAFPSMEVVHVEMDECQMMIPYIPGLLAFREVPPIVRLLDKIREKKPQFLPQLLIVDGNGVHHYRRCGFASHLGIVSGIPAIGVAKKLLAVDGLSREEFGEQFRAHVSKNPTEALMPIIGASGQLWGYAARTGKSASKPLFISPGHRIGFFSAAHLVLQMCKFHIPEPTRQADLRTRDFIRQRYSPAASDAKDQRV